MKLEYASLNDTHIANVKTNDGKLLVCEVVYDTQGSTLLIAGREFCLREEVTSSFKINIDGKDISIAEIINEADDFIVDLLPGIEQDQKYEDDPARYLKSPYLTGRI